tara:strand:- start:19399 stop:20553 length:1155 start_codon:yes stop_codon:yes gene_type:complete
MNDISAQIDLDKITQYFIENGYNYFNPSMTLPAEIVMNFMGEDVRNRLLFVASPDGQEYCIRPDFTLSLALDYLRNNNTASKFVYDGLAFRFPSAHEKTRSCPEFRQIGIEDFGSKDKLETEIRIITEAYDILRDICNFELEITISDIGLFFQLLDSISLSDQIKNKLKRLYWRGSSINEFKSVIELEQFKNKSKEFKFDTSFIGEYKKKHISSQDFIKKIAKDNNLTIYSSRSPDDIALSFIDQYESFKSNPINKPILDLLIEFLSMEKSGASFINDIEIFANKYEIDLKEEIQKTKKRLLLLEKKGIPIEGIQFKTTLARKVEYYTGLIFEISAKDASQNNQIAIGGRYDNIFTELGSKSSVPAVGCAIYIDRLIYTGKLYG